MKPFHSITIDNDGFHNLGQPTDLVAGTYTIVPNFNAPTLIVPLELVNRLLTYGIDANMEVPHINDQAFDDLATLIELQGLEAVFRQLFVQSKKENP